MKSDPDVSSVSEEAVFMATKATEAFIEYMVQQVIDANGNPQTIEYDHVSHLVQTQEKLNFLKGPLPMRTSIREIQERQGQEAIDMVLPERYAASEISLSSDDDFEEKKAASATHETISKSTLETSPELSSFVLR